MLPVEGQKGGKAREIHEVELGMYADMMLEGRCEGVKPRVGTAGLFLRAEMLRC